MIDPTPTLEFYEDLTRKKINATIQRTFQPNCGSCQAKKMHSPDDWEKFHPGSRTGTIDGKFFGKSGSR